MRVMIAGLAVSVVALVGNHGHAFPLAQSVVGPADAHSYAVTTSEEVSGSVPVVRHITWAQAGPVCARAAFLADDYAHTHTGARAERRAVEACGEESGGF